MLQTPARLAAEVRLHFGDSLVGERKTGVEFYAFMRQAPGTEPVYSFWHEGNQDRLHYWDVVRAC